MGTKTESSTTSKPVRAHDRLNVFAGHWNTEGQTRAGKDSPSVKIKAFDAYEWLEGGFFLIHRIDALVGDEAYKGIEIIGYDDGNDKYFAHSFDNYGKAVTMTVGVNNKGIWKFTGETERFEGMFSEDGNTLSGTWERSTDGENWEPWMAVTLTKIK